MNPAHGRADRRRGGVDAVDASAHNDFRARIWEVQSRRLHYNLGEFLGG